jgi:hypothetical protein
MALPPRLQSLALNSISFPALPTLLLSATHLVRLTLHWIPHSGYFSPEAIVTALAVMASLKFLTIKFESPLSRPHNGSRRPPPPTPTVLPALARFDFKGASEYLEDFVARIDAPLLDSIHITFFLQLVFNIPRLAQFMGRTTKFQVLKEAHVYCDAYGGHVETLPPTRAIYTKSALKISCRKLDWQLSSLAQVFPSFFPSIHLVEHLYIYKLHQPTQQDIIENMQLLEILHPFTAVKNLYLTDEAAGCIEPALEELVGGRTMEVLPMLQEVFIEMVPHIRQHSEGIPKFVAARQLSGHPITVSHSWRKS